VEAEKTGFAKALRSGVELLPNVTARVNFELTAGAVTQTIDVSANATPLLQTDRADTGGKIDQKQLQQMPMLYNRNYQGLLLLVPGVDRPFRPHSEFYNSHDSLSVHVNGQGRQFNNFQIEFQIEGIENKIDNGNLTALVPPAEAIQTVDVSTSNFDPEFGNAGGAVTNVTLRSGGNDFHGSDRGTQRSRSPRRSSTRRQGLFNRWTRRNLHLPKNVPKGLGGASSPWRMSVCSLRACARQAHADMM